MDLTVSLYKIHAHQGLPSNLPPAPILLIKRINFISGTQPRANLQGLVQSTPDRYKLILSDGEYNMRALLHSSLNFLVSSDPPLIKVSGRIKLDEYSTFTTTRKNGAGFVRYILITSVVPVEHTAGMRVGGYGTPDACGTGSASQTVSVIDKPFPTAIPFDQTTLRNICYLKELETKKHRDIVDIFAVVTFVDKIVNRQGSQKRDIDLMDLTNPTPTRLSVWQDVSAVTFQIGDVVFYQHLTAWNYRNTMTLNAFIQRNPRKENPRIFINPQCPETNQLREWWRSRETSNHNHTTP